jgi:AraC-like DNA-binding protein
MKTRGRPKQFKAKTLAVLAKRFPEISRTELAAKVGCSIGTLYKLAEEGGIQLPRRLPKPPYQAKLSHEQRRLRRQKLVAYATVHPQASLGEIAMEFGLSPTTTLQYLKAAGVKMRGRQVRGEDYRHPNDSLKDPDSPRCQTLRQGIIQDWTLERIGEALGVTRERARQLRNAYISFYGEPELEPRKPISEIAKDLGFSKGFVYLLSKQHNIGRSCGRLPGGGARRRTVNAEEAQELLRIIREQTQRICDVCGRTFLGVGKGPAKTCSLPCRKKYHLQRSRQASRLANFRPERLTFWKGLIPMLEKHRPPEETTYLSREEAMSLAGTSAMQLAYLRALNIIRWKPDPSGKNRQGTPYAIYAASDMRIVRDFLRRKQQVKRGNISGRQKGTARRVCLRAS